MATPSHNRRLSSKKDVKFTIEHAGLVKKTFRSVIIESCLLENKRYKRIEEKVIAYLCRMGTYFQQK